MALSQVISKLAADKLATKKKKPKPNAKAPLGQGGRFAAGVAKMTAKGMDEGEASAIMAKEGRSKYGDKRFDAMAQKGKR